MNHKKQRQDKVDRQIQKEYIALAQLRKERELGVICVQNDITKEDLYNLIRHKKSIEDFDWTK